MKLSIELDISKVAVTLYSVMCLLVETAINSPSFASLNYYVRLVQDLN